jgi:hypothetical protein
MKRPCLKSSIIGGLLFLSILLSGCGTVRVGYSLAPDFAHGWLDGYVGFDEAQSELAREQIGQFFRWHRATQLPVYAKFLARARSDVADNITPASACKWYTEGFGLLRPSLDRALPQAAQVVRGITPKQVLGIERKYQKVNADFRETYLQPAPKDRLKASVARAVGRAESLYGRLDAAQTERLTKGIAASPFDPDVWLAERMRRQQDALKVLRRLAAASGSAHPPSVDAVQASLKPLVEQVLVSPDAGYRAYQDRLLTYNCGLASQLHNSTSREQRAAAAARLKGWEDDILSLAAAGLRN